MGWNEEPIQNFRPIEDYLRGDLAFRKKSAVLGGGVVLVLRVANRGILFKVYRGVPVTFAMTPLAARVRCRQRGGLLDGEILAPAVPLEVPPAPAGLPSLSRRMSLVVPPEVPGCP